MDLWSVTSFIIISLLLLSSLHIFINLLQPANESWWHIKEYLLKDYLLNTVTLVLITGITTAIIGTSLSWLVTVYDFPMKKFFKWAMILPLALPANIAAYTYSGMLGYTGVIQTQLRNRFDVQVNQKYFDIMNIEGAIFIFTLCLFPYVYTITRAFLEKQSASLIECARMLGRKPGDIFFTIVLPCSRAAIIGGVSLVALEVLNDYGVVQYFGIPTFSTAIFKSWFGMGDLNSAIRLAAILMLMVAVILISEKYLRGTQKYSDTTAKVRPISPQVLTGLKGTAAFSYCFFIFSLGFLLPTLQLLYWSLITYHSTLNAQFFQLLFNSLSLAFTAMVLIVIIAVIVANYCRINEHAATAKIYANITVIGYTVPGAVIAIGVMVFFISLDNQLTWFYNTLNINSSGLVLTASIAMLIFAYVIRFLAMGFNSIQAGFEKAGKKFFEASRILGAGTIETFMKIDLPMLKPAIFSSCVLVFVEVLKELPLTLLLRPFNFDTLATKVFQYASDEMLAEAAVPSMIIIGISFMAILFFHHVTTRGDY
ncbi:MAG: iron ABC transporter [Peptococcaceae bacterium BRH_c8a]|nr:MAG: iron ABC transporter [Peptococcaceae bacterium BRH_c8a]